MTAAEGRNPLDRPAIDGLAEARRSGKGQNRLPGARGRRYEYALPGPA